jgi:predicted acyl esterase
VARLLLAVCAAAAALASAGEAAAFSKTELPVTMDDGVAIAATLYLPDGQPPADGWPAVMMLHGLGANRAWTNGIAEQTFASQGYAVLTFDARGHGESAGLFTADGPREVRDVRALFDWLAARPDVADARIGAWGVSLGGGAVLRSLLDGVPFAAAEVIETWTDLYQALVPGGLSKSGAIYAFLNSVPAERTGPDVLGIRADALASRNLPGLRAFAEPRSSRPSLARIRTPVYVFQGRRDFAFGLEQGLALFQGLGGPKRLYIGPFGHAPSTFPAADAAQVYAEGSNWFARFLKGQPNGIDAGPRVVLGADPYRELAGARYHGLPPTQTLSYGVNGRRAIGSTGSTVRTVAARTPRLLETFGAPTLTVTASGSYPHLVAVLKAVTPAGAEVTVSEGGATVRLTRTPRKVRITMISQATTIPRGSRLTLRLGPTSGDLLYIQGVPSAARATIGDATLALPVLRQPISG